MGWPYHFVGLDEAQKHRRRIALDIYANIAQSSILTVLLFVQVYFLEVWLTARLSKQSRVDGTSSPRIKEGRLDPVNGTRGWQVRARKLNWWFGERVEVAGAYIGSRGQVGLALGWLTWLLILCVPDTGDGMISSYHFTSLVSTYRTHNRLPTPDEALRNRSSVPATTSLPFGLQVAVLTYPTSHWLLPRNPEHIPPPSWPNHYISIPTSCSILPQLLRPVQPSRHQGQGALHHLWYPGCTHLHNYWNDSTGSGKEMELPRLLRNTCRSGNGMDARSLLPCISYPYLHL